MSRNRVRMALFVVGLAVSCTLARPSQAGITRLGVLGDSLSDEYFEASYGAYARNWTVLLDQEWGLDLGPTASQAGRPGNTWGSPRYGGYEYNWARAGATSSTLLSEGQHTGLAGQVATKGISHAVMLIGANDFAPGSTAYNQIYNNNWSASQIESYVSSRVTNVATALDTVLPTGVKLVLGNFPDYAVAPAVKSAYPNAVWRDRVTSVVAEVNTRLRQVAIDRGLALVDIFDVSKAIFGTNTNPHSTLKLGNVDLLLESTNQFGATPTAAFVHDGIHIMTTLQGLLANLFLDALDLAYGAGVPLKSEAEILAMAGIGYGGSDTLVAQIGPLSDYIEDFTTPELIGDANGDCTVGAADYALWAAQFGASGMGLSADFDGSGSVGAGDYALWAANFGSTCAVGSSVPEPSAAGHAWSALVWLASLGVVTRWAARGARPSGLRPSSP